jgi:hypothetical protein
LGGFHANSLDSPENTDFADELISGLARLPILRSRFRFDYFVPHIWGWRRGLRMTRLFAAAAISICFAFLIPLSANAQSDRDPASDNQCFPWQEFRDGHCVAKPSQTEPPPPAPVVSDPCMKDTRNLSAQCVCPENTHRDAASGACLADIQPTRKADEKNIVCDGGTIASGACGCPIGFHLVAAGGNRAGGACVRSNAENCLGGELTATGTCLCNGQVVMSGETYLLEYASGKCVPKRCPVQTVLQDGRCVAMSATSPSLEPEEKSKPAAPKEASEEGEHRHHCGHGMVRTHAGCVQARRRLPVIDGNRIGGYYRMYQFPGAASTPPN